MLIDRRGGSPKGLASRRETPLQGLSIIMIAFTILRDYLDVIDLYLCANKYSWL